MNAQFAQPATFDEEKQQELSLKNKRFGLLMWRIANGMVFVFFAFAYYLMRSVQATWPPEGIARLSIVAPTIFTVVILFSYLPAVRAQNAIRRDDQGATRRNILAACGLGVIFLVGIALMWRDLTPGSAFSAIYYAMLGLHAVHVLAGMIVFGYVYTKTGQYNRNNYWGIEGAVVFWQFVVLMWAFFYLVLYIL